MVLLLIMTFGRLGSVTGNILLPLFIKINCWAPFVWLTFLMLRKSKNIFSYINLLIMFNFVFFVVSFVMSLFLKVNIKQALN